MPPFVRRTILGNIPNSPYYNEDTFVGQGGHYKDNKWYQCMNGMVGRECELAEEKITYFPSIKEKPEDVKYQFCNRSGYPNAIELWNKILWNKTTKASEVKLGDVVMYGTGYGWDKVNKQYLGHVRVIEAIEDDYFICSGANEDSKGNFRFDIKIPKQDGSGDKLEGLIGYAHNPYLTESKDKDYKKLYLEAQAKLDKIKGII